MGREKRPIPAAVAGGPKERHKRAQKSQYDSKVAALPNLVARKQPPAASKHHSYYEIVDNVEKKEKPLEFKVTDATTDHPGYTLVPIGDPELTKECKELTRERGALVFIVSAATEGDPNFLSYHVHRTGHKFRDTIVEEAKQKLSRSTPQPGIAESSEIDAMPASQNEYFKQADKTIRDLFPRIPHPDRQRIVSHAFDMNAPAPENQREPRVGLSWKLTLARRVQLAALAHIRHTHTRYDELLKETSWQNARRAVEPVCLDFLVKWRGDDETGRDQLDEILREVVVISDTEDDESSDEYDAEETQVHRAQEVDMAGRQEIVQNTTTGVHESMQLCDPQPEGSGRSTQLVRDSPIELDTQPRQRKGPLEKKQQRGFKRYRRAWEDAVQRQRDHDSPNRLLSPAERTYSPARPLVDEVTKRPPVENAGAVPYANGYVPRPAGLGAPIDMRTYPPPPPPPAPTRLQPGDAMSSAPPVGANLTQAPREFSPMANRFQDLLVRSIEPTSPETMAPAFVRTLPPRSQPSPTSRPQLRALASPGPPFQQHSVHGDRHMRHPSGGYEDRYPYSQGTRSHAASPIEGWQPEGRRRHQNDSFQRPGGDISRPADRSNPIVMVDMGGFLQRVSRADDAFATGRDYIEPRPLGRGESSYHAATTQRMVPHEDGARILRENHGAADLQRIPTHAPRHYAHITPPNHSPVDPNPRQVIYFDGVQYGGQQPRSTYDNVEVRDVRGAFAGPRVYAGPPQDMYVATDREFVLRQLMQRRYPRQPQARAPLHAQPLSSVQQPHRTYLPREERQNNHYTPPPRPQGAQPSNVVILD